MISNKIERIVWMRRKNALGKPEMNREVCCFNRISPWDLLFCLHIKFVAHIVKLCFALLTKTGTQSRDYKHLPSANARD